MLSHLTTLLIFEVVVIAATPTTACMDNYKLPVIYGYIFSSSGKMWPRFIFFTVIADTNCFFTQFDALLIGF
jgi:hypothetical protein